MTSLLLPHWLPPAATVVLVALTGARFHPLPLIRRPETRLPETRRRRPGLLDADRRTDWSARARRAFGNESNVGPADLAGWIDDVSRSVGHGRTLRHALLDVRPHTTRLDHLTEPLRHALDRGSMVADACDAWLLRSAPLTPTERRHVATTASVLAVAATVGGSITQPLDRLAAALRRAEADELERHAQAAQARISMRVLTIVPFAVLALLVALDADVRAVCTTPIGAAMVAGGVALDLTGGWWMRRVIGGARA